MADYFSEVELTDAELLQVIGGTQPSSGTGLTGGTYSIDGSNPGNYSATSLNGYAYGQNNSQGSIGSYAGPNNGGGYYSTGGGSFSQH